MKSLRMIAATLMIVFFYIKIVGAVVLEMENTIFLDLGIYLFALLSIDFRHVKYNIFVVLGFLLLAVFVSSARSLALLFFVAYCLKDVPFRYVAKVNLLCSIVVFLYLVVNIQLGILEDAVMVSPSGRLRYDLGTGNPNTFGILAYGLCANLYVLLAQKHRFALFLIIIPLAACVYQHSGSRTFLLSIIILLGSYCFYRSKSHRFILSSTILSYLPLFFTIASVLCALAVAVVPALDIFFSFRLSYYNRLLLGTSPIQWLVGNPLVDEMTIDSSYMHMLFRAGFFGYLLFLFLCIRGIKNTAPEERYMYPLVLATFCYGVTETIMFFTLVFNNMIVWVYLFQRAYPNKPAVNCTPGFHHLV